MKLAQCQAAYDGASMVFARNEALSFLGRSDCPGHAHVSTFTTDGTTLNAFAHYSSTFQGQVNYHQYPTSTSPLTSSYEDFKKGLERLRNLEEDAKETAENLRDGLIKVWSAPRRRRQIQPKSCEKPQGISKRQPAKTILRKARNR